MSHWFLNVNKHYQKALQGILKVKSNWACFIYYRVRRTAGIFYSMTSFDTGKCLLLCDIVMALTCYTHAELFFQIYMYKSIVVVTSSAMLAIIQIKLDSLWKLEASAWLNILQSLSNNIYLSWGILLWCQFRKGAICCCLFDKLYFPKDVTSPLRAIPVQLGLMFPHCCLNGRIWV